jgi:hypothetical protein
MGEWLDRALIVSPVFYALCTTEAGYAKILKGMGVPKDEWPSFTSFGAGATTHFFTKDGKTSAVVCVLSPKGVTKTQIHALLTHEAVHLWQEILEQLHENKPSIEFEAYSIQMLTQNLVFAYEKQMQANRKAK